MLCTIPKLPAKRSTYSWTNAQKFQPIFDKFLETGEPIQVDAKQFNLSISTFYIALPDALLYLSDCARTEPDRFHKYMELKDMIKLQRGSDGIIICYKQSFASLKTVKANPVLELNDILDFVENSKIGDKFERSSVTIRPDTKTKLIDTLAISDNFELQLEDHGLVIYRKS